MAWAFLDGSASLLRVGSRPVHDVAHSGRTAMTTAADPIVPLAGDLCSDDLTVRPTRQVAGASRCVMPTTRN